MKHPNSSQQLRSPGTDFSKTALRQLQRLVDLLDKWRKITNLVSDRSFAEVWQRHIADSHFVYQASSQSRKWLDLGSGAGFPGLVIGILLEDYSEAQVHCVEADKRKCAFLRLVAQELRLPVKVYQMRAELLQPTLTGSVDAVTSRAFSSLIQILDFADDYLAEGAVAILPRGRSAIREIESLDPNRYRVDVGSNPGRSDGLILKVWQRGMKSDALRRPSDAGV